MKKKTRIERPAIHQRLRNYAPAFSKAEDYAAREEGYEDAAERWCVNMDIRMTEDYHRNVHEHGKAGRRADLESIGRPFERLGAMSDMTSQLPQVSDYKEPEIVVPKDDYQRRAAVHGLKNRLVRWLDFCERDGFVPSQDSDLESAESDQFAFRKWEGEDIRKRMEAMGADFDEAMAGVESGEIEYQDYFPENPNSDDPEIQNVYEQYDKDMESFDATHAWEENLEEDDDE